ncbi:MAG: hypothetical protein WBV90_02795 [Terrimicrobiaceae bacterium]
MAEQGEDADTKFAVTKHRCAEMNKPGDHRRVIEIAEVEMASVEPVVGFFWKKVGRGESGESEQQQPGHKNQRSAGNR